MAALSQERNTREVYCNATTLHRVHPTGSSTVYIGSICALNSDGKIVPASDASGLVVLGRCEAHLASGKTIAKTGVFLYDNGTSTEALSAADINKIVYVVDDHTVGKVGGTNEIPAGTLRDVLPDGQLAVELGCVTILPPPPPCLAAEA